MAMNQLQVRQPPGAPSLYQPTFLETLDGMPVQDWVKYFGAGSRIKNANDHRRRDARIIAAAATVSAGRKPFFSVPLNGADTTLDGGTAINPKPAHLTNMVDDNRIEYGSIMIVDRIECFLIATKREFSTIVAGQPTNLGAAAGEGTSATNTVVGLSRLVYLTFKVGQDLKADGRIAEFPSSIVFNGAFGGESVTGGVGDEGFIQIGAGQPRPLKEIVVLRPGQYFTADLEFLNAVTVPQNVEIEIALCGVILREVG